MESKDNLKGDQKSAVFNKMIQSKDQTGYNYSISMGLSGQCSEYIENNYE